MRGFTKKAAAALCAAAFFAFGAGTLSAMAAEVVPTDAGYDVRYGENRPITGSYDPSLAVKCINGTFVGRETEGVLEFKGIPFVAEQPVGKNRWKAPVPFKPDSGVYEAVYFGRHPLQNMAKARDYVEGEDCLHLNVYKAAGPAAKRPVMVWIYGGGFQVGGTADPYYDGHSFVRDNPEVILVTLNYRSGPYGFLHLSHLEGGEEYPDAQNLGILDQRLALRWVKENIGAFGGDEENITIFGESAGGSSVMLHVISRESRPYFRRAIAQSGFFSFTNSPEQMKAFTDKLMREAGCRTLEDLQNADPRTLVNLYSRNFLAIFPERDGRTVPVDPYRELSGGAAKNIELMVGCTANEAYSFVKAVGGTEVFGPLYRSRAAKLLSVCTPEENGRVIDYLNTINGTEGVRMHELCNQLIFFCPLKRTIDAQLAAGGRVHAYLWTAPALQLKEPVAGHGADVPVVLNTAAANGLEAERTPFDRAVQRLWVSFAVNGNPSFSAEDTPYGDLSWEPFTKENRFMLGIDRDGFTNQYEGFDRLLRDGLLSLTDYYMF